MSARILFVGEDKPGTRAQQRLAALREMGHAVTFIRTNPEGETYETPPGLAKRIRHRLRRPADPAGANMRLRQAVTGAERPDIIWIDSAAMIRPETYRVMKAAWPDVKLVWYAEDDIAQPHNSTVWLERSLGLFDLWVTTKSYNARPEEMPARGVRRVLFVNNSYDPATHRRITLDDADRDRFGAEVSFVGTFERDRADSLLRLAEADIPVRIWGNGWRSMAGRHSRLVVENRPVYGDDLAKVYNASAINLAFLRKLNRDLQTCRTVEIPACGGFMLHERTGEAAKIVEEDKHAAFFENDAELVEKCRFWLAHPDERRRVAEAGYGRVRSGGFSHHDRLRDILKAAETVPCAS